MKQLPAKPRSRRCFPEYGGAVPRISVCRLFRILEGWVRIRHILVRAGNY